MASSPLDPAAASEQDFDDLGQHRQVTVIDVPVRPFVLLVLVRNAEPLQLVDEPPQAPLEVVLVAQAALEVQELELLPVVRVTAAREQRVELEPALPHRVDALSRPQVDRQIEAERRV